MGHDHPPTVTPRRRAPRLAVAVALCAAAVVAAGPTTGAPDAGALTTTENPWLHRRVLAIAHAGGEDEAPHSTMYAYGKAVAEGVSMIDLDMQLSSDGIPVVMHNDTVDRTTDGTGAVSSMTYAQLHALDAAYWYSDACWACHDRPVDEYVFRGVRTGAEPPPAGFTADDFGVPSVREVFERFPDVPVDIEIKGTAPGSFAAADALAALIAEFGRADRTMVASFDDATLEHFSAVAPDVPTSASQQEVTDFFLSRGPVPGRQVLDVPPFYELGGNRIEVVTRQFVDDAHANGLAVWVWMDSGDEENADFYSHLVDLGVDGINAARPGVLVDVLRRRGVLWDGRDAPPTTSTTAPTTTTPGPTTTAPGRAPAARPVTANPSYTG